MTIAAGTKLGCWEVRSLVGEVGMGKVYLTRDTQLGANACAEVFAFLSELWRNELNGACFCQ